MKTTMTISLPAIAFWVLFILKIIGYDISWWTVTAPLWMSLALVGVIIVGTLVAGFIVFLVQIIFSLFINAKR